MDKCHSSCRSCDHPTGGHADQPGLGGWNGIMLIRLRSQKIVSTGPPRQGLLPPQYPAAGVPAADSPLLPRSSVCATSSTYAGLSGCACWPTMHVSLQVTTPHDCAAWNQISTAGGGMSSTDLSLQCLHAGETASSSLMHVLLQCDTLPRWPGSRYAHYIMWSSNF